MFSVFTGSSAGSRYRPTAILMLCTLKSYTVSRTATIYHNRHITVGSTHQNCIIVAIIVIRAWKRNWYVCAVYILNFDNIVCYMNVLRVILWNLIVWTPVYSLCFALEFHNSFLVTYAEFMTLLYCWLNIKQTLTSQITSLWSQWQKMH